MANLLELVPRIRFSLLWRGSRDGFRARDFHRCCDAQSHTLTVIRDTQGNIFGGFTPAAWESSFLSRAKQDRSLRSIRRMGVRDLVIADGCNVNDSHAHGFGSAYVNDSRVDDSLLFTGSAAFKVSEIEVFDIRE
jgi:hypothetical protein